MRQTPETLQYLSREIHWAGVKAAINGEEERFHLYIHERPAAWVQRFHPLQLEWYRHGKIIKPARLIGKLVVVTFAWQEADEYRDFQAFTIVRKDDEMYALRTTDEHIQATVEYLGIEDLTD